MFFHYNQNNSGGSFVIDDDIGIGPHVWIEANSQEKATAKALSLGIYFNGVEDDRDCACCGDRWYEPYDGYDVPEIDPKYHFGWCDTVYVHKKDGTIERIKPPS